MAQHNPEDLESVYTAHLLEQIHANLDLLLKQSKISRSNVDVIKNALPPHSTSIRSEAAIPEPSMVNGRAASSGIPLPTAMSQSNYGGSHVGQHQPSAPNFPAPPPPPSHPQPPQHYKQAKALWAYRASAPDDLSFEKGDIILVLAEENPDWWRGQVLNSQQPAGLFPSNHVEVVSAPPGPPPPPPPPPPNHFPSSQQYQRHQSNPPYPTGPPPQGIPEYQSPAYSQAPQYGDYKAPPPQAAPPPPLQHTQSAPPANITKNLLQGRFGQALAGGAGFGAGSAVATHVVNAIL
ncbi:hypothetical protein VP01_1450g6 [Puccinia sorghi]|uniref:SH3 domain-containing protein n=1 Tax=Puccinia sorghi TaxID=27349 RepID=A0A0L6VK76_9BASI|nr:hypothetical protein VP01_1450g6 [Puccinia sorghi]